jgi:hypothetical protein
VISRQWDPVSPTCVHWVQQEIGASVLLYDAWQGTLQVKTATGEKWVPYGWWISRNDQGEVIISEEEPVA